MITFSIPSSVHGRKSSGLKNFSGYMLEVEFLSNKALSTAKLQCPFKRIRIILLLHQLYGGIIFLMNILISLFFISIISILMTLHFFFANHKNINNLLMFL